MKLRLIAAFAGFLIAVTGAVMAQSQGQTSDGVARVSLIHGDVSTQRGDSGEWAAAALNQPMVAGDRISTGERSRTELQLDYANILRLDERTQANISNLTRTQIQIQLGQGLANYTVFKNSDADVQIDTPNVSVHPDRRGGSFRILVTGEDQTQVIARNGQADISTPQGSTHLDKGQMITVRGTGDQTQYKVADAPDKDAFDRWNNDRNNTIRNAQAWQHTNGYYTGSEDLDAYGRWSNVPDYGPVWVPSVAPGWAPYSAGDWVWEPGWGWTWVSYEPWGWAPYHYGRWMLYGGSWAWWPGPVYANPYYYPAWAPAYVSFFGFGGGGWGFSVGFGFGGGWGSIGWMPVGPCDRFYPWWGPYRSQYNVTNITNINNINNINNGGVAPLHGGGTYSNLRHAVNDPRFRNAISTVPANRFGQGHAPIQRANSQMMQNAHFVNGNLPVVPSRQSLSASGRPAASSTIPRGGQNQRFFSTGRTSVATPRSFETERAQVQDSIRQNSHFTPVNTAERSNAPARNVPQARNAPQAQPSRTNLGAGNTNNRGFSQPTNTASNAGWRSFGGPGQSGNPGTGTTSRGGPARAENPVSRAPQSSAQPRSFGSGNPRQNANDAWRSVPRPGNSAPMGGSSVRGPQNSPASRESGSPTGWRSLTPAPRNSQAESMSRPSAGQNQSWRNPQTNSSWRGSPDRGASSGPSRDYSRPPLNMRQPIVSPRSSGDSYGRGSYGGSYGGSRGGSYSAPRGGGSGGGYSAPRGGGSSAPSHSGGGGGRSSGGSTGGHRGR